MFTKKSAGVENHSWLTKSTLCDVLFDPGALAGVGSVLRQTLDRRERPSRRFAGRYLAGANRPSLLVDGARAADADPAAELRSGQAEVVAENPEERRIGITIEGFRNAVDAEI